MSSREEIRADRIAKRDQLVAAGIDPYPATTQPTHTIGAVQASFSECVASTTEITIAGRVLSIRRHGGSAFMDITDGTGDLQLFLSRDAVGEEAFTLCLDTVDPGDFLEVVGTAFVTKRDAEALAVTEWRMLTKALQATPSAHFGLKDDDERYRKRYLDLLLNPERRRLFEQKAKFWDVTRRFLQTRDFTEVETPTLELTTGGAEARPFRTYHNDFDLDVYLRISVGELWQKHLMAAGYPCTFEIGRVYRNEGTSPEHLQEFTNCEFYMAYADYRDGMHLVQDLYRTLAKEVFGTTKFTARGHTFDLADEWTEIDYVTEVERQTGVNVLRDDIATLRSTLEKLGVTYEGDNRERLTDTLWKYCRQHIAGPAFLVHHPKVVAPLAKTRPGTETVEMFQPLLAGSEVGRGYSELNDPVDQRERFAVQQALLEAGDEEAMMPDWEFVEMLEYGMPPTCGFGFGERLFAFLAGLPIRETQLFPLMRPRSGEEPTPTAEE